MSIFDKNDDFDYPAFDKRSKMVPEEVEVEEFDIKCFSCEKSLLNILMLPDRPNSPIVNQVMVNCPFCGGHSFKEQLKGQMMARPAAGLKHIDSDVKCTDPPKTPFVNFTTTVKLEKE